jgi:hypothetical protein
MKASVGRKSKLTENENRLFLAKVESLNLFHAFRKKKKKKKRYCHLGEFNLS